MVTQTTPALLDYLLTSKESKNWILHFLRESHYTNIRFLLSQLLSLINIVQNTDRPFATPSFLRLFPTTSNPSSPSCKKKKKNWQDHRVNQMVPYLLIHLYETWRKLFTREAKGIEMWENVVMLKGVQGGLYPWICVLAIERLVA